MSVINPNETARSWQAAKREAAVQLYLSGCRGRFRRSSSASRRRLPGQPQHPADTDWIDPEELSAAAAAVVQVDPDTPASIKRFQKLAQVVPTRR